MSYKKLLTDSIHALDDVSRSEGLDSQHQLEIQTIVEGLRKAISNVGIDDPRNGQNTNFTLSSTELQTYKNILGNILKEAYLTPLEKSSIETAICDLREAMLFIEIKEGKLKTMVDGLSAQADQLRRVLQLIQEKQGHISPEHSHTLEEIDDKLRSLMKKLMQDNGISSEDLKPELTIAKLRDYLEIIKRQGGIPFQNAYFNFSAQTYEAELNYRKGLYTQKDYKGVLADIHEQILKFAKNFNLDPNIFK